MKEEIVIRNAEPGDLSQIAVMEEQIFSEPWTVDGFSDALAREENIFLVATAGDEIAGYGLLYGMMDEGEIPTIAIRPSYQRRGIGTKLLLRLMETAEENGISHIFLEVRQSNLPAQRLYGSCGFAVVGERKQFYRFPTEDAFVMAYHKEG